MYDLIGQLQVGVSAHVLHSLKLEMHFISEKKLTSYLVLKLLSSVSCMYVNERSRLVWVEK